MLFSFNPDVSDVVLLAAGGNVARTFKPLKLIYQNIWTWSISSTPVTPPPPSQAFAAVGIGSLKSKKSPYL